MYIYELINPYIVYLIDYIEVYNFLSLNLFSKPALLIAIVPIISQLINLFIKFNYSIIYNSRIRVLKYSASPWLLTLDG